MNTDTHQRHSTGSEDANLVAALIVHYVAGFVWLLALGALVALASSKAVGIVWSLCAAPLWIVDSVRMVRIRRQPAQVWRLSLTWWLRSFLAPLFLLIEAAAYQKRPTSTSAAEAPRFAPARASADQLDAMLDDFGRRLESLEREFADLSRAIRTAPTAPLPQEPPAGYPVAATRPRPAPAAHTQALPAQLPPVELPEPAWWSGLTLADLFSAKVLAWAGGLVTLLGIVFFFVLAVNRGWIGPVARVSLGALASAVVFSAGLYVRRRFGHLYYSAYGAVGAGIGGGYGTLLAARLQYDLVSDWAALVIAAAIAAIGVATALAWSSELIAGLGLIGATLAPAAVGLHNGELGSAGTAFAALVFAATAIVALGKRWQVLLAVGFAATLPQVGVLVGQAERTDWDVGAVAALIWLLYLASAVGLQLRFASPDLASAPTALILAGAVFGGVATAAQFSGSAEGWTLLSVSAVYGAVAAALFPRKADRDLSALLAAIGLAVAAVALADLVSGPTLTIAWAAEAAVLAWLARRIDELRYQIASLVYLAAALVHAVALDAPLRQLYRASEHPARGLLAFVGVALAGSVVAYYCRAWTSAHTSAGILTPLQPALDAFRENQPLWRAISGWISALAALYVGSLGVLGIAQWVTADRMQRAFEWGHVAVAGLWGIVALGVLAAGLRRSRPQLRIGGLVWLGAMLAQAVLFFAESLTRDPRSFGFLVIGGALLGGALVDRLRAKDPGAFPAIAVYSVASLALGVAGLVELIGADKTQGAALLALTAFYCALAWLVHRRDRDLSTLLWAPALVVAVYATDELVSGTWTVLFWASLAAALVLVADRAADRRLQVASAAYLLLAAGHALGIDAPPHDFFQTNRHPAVGVPSLVLVLLAAGAFAWYCDKASQAARGGDAEGLAAELDRRQGLWLRTTLAANTVLALYTVSLAILGLAEATGTGSVAARFHGGHSAISAVWGAIGLAALYVGLRTQRVWLQAVGFALFAISLAKIFLYDLTFLSSVTRALSFLAVGAVLLLGGFFVQRLGAERRAA